MSVGRKVVEGGHGLTVNIVENYGQSLPFCGEGTVGDRGRKG